RRRHTRSDRDWSSDVCSSDLAFRRAIGTAVPAAHLPSHAPGYAVRIAAALFAQGRRETRRHARRLNTLVDWRFFQGILLQAILRSEERRVGKEWRSRRAARGD